MEKITYTKKMWQSQGRPTEGTTESQFRLILFKRNFSKFYHTFSKWFPIVIVKITFNIETSSNSF